MTGNTSSRAQPVWWRFSVAARRPDCAGLAEAGLEAMFRWSISTNLPSASTAASRAAEENSSTALPSKQSQSHQPLTAKSSTQTTAGSHATTTPWGYLSQLDNQLAELQRIEAQLLCNKGAQCFRWLLALLQDASRKSQIAKHKGKTKTIGVAAATIDQR
jgi:hypothetical protein